MGETSKVRRVIDKSNKQWLRLPPTHLHVLGARQLLEPRVDVLLDAALEGALVGVLDALQLESRAVNLVVEQI